MRARARVHAMFPLDEMAEQELDQRLDALVAEIRNEQQPELAVLRTLVRELRTAARWGDLPEVQRLLTEHATNAVGRRAALLDAIRRDPFGRWKSGRAVTVLRVLGWHPVSPGTAGRDLSTLAAAGHLIRHEAKGVRWYELKAVAS